MFTGVTNDFRPHSQQLPSSLASSRTEVFGLKIGETPRSEDRSSASDGFQLEV